MANAPAAIIRAVCDTNVLVPPHYRKRLQEAAVARCFTPVWSPWIIAELYRVLTWKWAQDHGVSEPQRRRCSNAANKMMILLGNYWELVNIPQPWPAVWPSLRDPNDQPIWATAKISDAQYVISNNTHDFPPANAKGQHLWEGIEYIPVETFLTKVLHL